MNNNMINIDETIRKAAKEAIREFDKEKREKQKNRRIHNTKLLMRHYNILKEHIDNVNYDIDKVKINIENEEFSDGALIMSIVRTKLRTMKMMGYIDSALKIIKEKMKQNCEEYKYKAFELYYIDRKTNEEIQFILSCGKNSPKKWSDLVIEELSILLWGIESMYIY